MSVHVREVRKHLSALLARVPRLLVVHGADVLLQAERAAQPLPADAALPPVRLLVHVAQVLGQRLA